jgi:hypothetical protein
MTITEISRRQIQLNFFNIQPFVYQFYVNENYPTWAEFWTDTFGVEQPVDNTRYFVTGFFVSPDGRYNKEATQQLAIDTEGSWYWDNENQIGTVHLNHIESPYTHIHQIAFADGYSDDRLVYIDDIPYRPLILAVPRVSQSQDLQNYSVPSYLTGSVVLSNLDDGPDSDGALDFLIEEKVNGNDIDIYTLDHVDGNLNYTRSDLTARVAAFIRDYDFTLKEIDIRIQDRRESQNLSIPSERFFPSQYPDLDSGLIGKPVPLLYGQAVDIPAICTNGNTTFGAVNYRAALLLTTLGIVQVDITGNGNWSIVTAATTDLDSGSFTLNSADGRDANGKPLACRLVTPFGILISRLSDVIIDLNSRFLNIPFTASNYDLAEWAAESVGIASGAYYIDSEKLLSDAIVEIQNGANIGFRYEILPDGRRTLRADDENRVSSGRIINRHIQNRDQIPVKNDISTLAAEIVIGFNRQYSSGDFSRLVDTSQKERVQQEYNQAPRFPRSGTLATFLTDSGDAQERADYIKARFSDVRGVVELVLMGQQYINIRIYDIFDVELTPASWVDGSEIRGRRYYGIRKIKIIEVDPDFQRVTNYVRAVIIV